MVPEHAHALYLKLIGERNLAIADLQVYVRSPVGVGEHPDIGEIYLAKLKQIDQSNSLIAVMEQIFPGIENGQIKEPEYDVRKTPQEDHSKNDLETKESSVDLKDSDLSSDVKVVGAFPKEDS